MKQAFSPATRRPAPHKQKGVTMTELSFVLLVAGIIGIGVVTAFGSTSSSAQATQLSDDLNALVGKVKSAYSGQYANVTNTKLSTGGFFKNYASLTDNAGTVTTSLGGGALSVVPGTVTAANDSVKYTLTQLPDSSCLPLVTALVKSVTTLNVNANTVKSAGTQPDPSKITCANDNNTLVFQVQ